MAGLRRLKSALIREGRKRVQAEWASHFEKNPAVGKTLMVLSNLLTDHNRLRKYLYRRKLAESDQCVCGQNEDSTLHLLLECPKWEALQLSAERGCGTITPQKWVPGGAILPYMLGGWKS